MKGLFHASFIENCPTLSRSFEGLIPLSVAEMDKRLWILNLILLRVDWVKMSVKLFELSVASTEDIVKTGCPNCGRPLILIDLDRIVLLVRPAAL